MRLNQITVPALDLERSVAFYQTLGLKLIVRNDHYARFEMPDGDATLSLELTDDVQGAANGPHVYFECQNLDARVAALKAEGIVFDSDPADQRWLWREAWLTDPAGVKLCLYYAGKNRLNPPWRLRD
ncbi:MAG: VOC family protein [Alphaproteobacteria bacterium]|nr:VOC family protein [Alphaproteobacteria bacterium]MDE1987766.1 VOC family protein [Alphaproteobacteria bacterium]MDE2264819.1 VOC family protein [Alphaproteobacteria bacterium]MDE2500102.1 VOC family protein [Alphaproteobacteria bacterium]